MARARELMTQLQPVATKYPDVKFLIELVRAREAHPSERWTNSAIRAWARSGRPRPGRVPLIEVQSDLVPIDPQQLVDARGPACLS